MNTKLKNGEYVDDYIREQKRKGIKEMYWPEEEWKLVNKFMDAIGGFTDGNLFFGIRHYETGTCIRYMI